ncbi:hypothetical protein [Mesorhizobium kowhaii]|uniref:hypothetical protein n=1 Tax=Mesorhizobium kowhaii TaxID=1300272 RepID=UPI003CCB2734
MTTNRPEDIEDALASRPGRVDEAIEIPLPDASCRERLIALYGRALVFENGAVTDAALGEQQRGLCQGNGPPFGSKEPGTGWR